MLPKSLRLKKRGSFAYVYKKGERRSAGLLTISYVKSKSLKIGFSVSNKVGKAVVRNKLKRRLRAVSRGYIKELSPVQAVISAKPGAAELSFDEIRGLIYKLFVNAKLINGQGDAKPEA